MTESTELHARLQVLEAQRKERTPPPLPGQTRIPLPPARTTAQQLELPEPP